MTTLAAYTAAVNLVPLYESGITDADRGWFSPKDILDTEAQSWVAHLADEAVEQAEFDRWLDGNADELAEAAAVDAAFDTACYHGHGAF